MSLAVTAEPTEMPVDLTAVKAHLRITDNNEDSLILGYLKAAVGYVEEYTWSQLCTATFTERWDCFPCTIYPQKNPLQSVTSLAYVDTAGVTQTLVAGTDYVVDASLKPARIYPAYSKWWPSTRGMPNDVTMVYIAGYSSVEAIPDEIKMALMLKTEMMRSSCDIDTTGRERAMHALLDLRSFRVFY